MLKSNPFAFRILRTTITFLTNVINVCTGIEAESVAYTVCQYFGIDTTEYSFGYIAGWSKEHKPEELRNSLSAIGSTAQKIIDQLDAILFVEKKNGNDIENDC